MRQRRIFPLKKKAANGGILVEDGVEELLFSQNFACHECGISIEEMSPRMFSFNSPFGACPDCTGLGYQEKIDPLLVVPDDSLSLNKGAIAAMGWNSANGIASMYLKALADEYGFFAGYAVARTARRNPQGYSLRYGRKENSC